MFSGLIHDLGADRVPLDYALRQAREVLMNERVKAIFLAALKLSAEERQELAQLLMDTLGADPADADQLCFDTGDDSDSEVPPQPTSDVLARYLDN
jgi:hypothetical protein